MAYLLLSNGRAFEGKRFGAEKDGVGEVVFTTGVVGYLETLTDPAYAGQIIVQTFPLIGNYGVISEDLNGECYAHGYVVRELCRTPSNFRSEGELDAYLKEKGIAGIEGIDTRELTRIIRDEGVMNGIICDTLPEDISALEGFSVAKAALATGTKVEKTYLPEGDAVCNVAVIDMGSGEAAAKALVSRGCKVTLLPRETTAEKLLCGGFDGAVLSDGAGDPADCVFTAEEMKKLVGQIPLLGISLGHQIIALSQGAKTCKMKYGHRGGQPVKETDGTRTLITSQNHGYAVDSDSLAGIGKITFVNANDGTCEGVTYSGKKCFSVQFTLDGRDTSFLYDKFISMMGGDGNAQR